MPNLQPTKETPEALAQQRRLEILAAMERLIVRGGIEAVTTRKIAEEMGATIGVIWHYFRDKSALFHELVAVNFDRWFAAAQADHHDGDTWRRFKGLFLNTMPEYGSEHAVVWFALLQKILNEPKLRDDFIERYTALRALAETLFGECQAEGLIRPDLNAALECQRLFALADGLSLSALTEPERVNDAMVSLLMETQLAALRPAAPI